jgi:hemoglobin
VERSIYEAAGGRRAFVDLAHAWHARCLADPVVSHAFSHGYHPQHTERLAAYWAEALGGPPDYTGSMGDESHVVRLHSGNGEHEEMDERAQVCFAHALDDVGLSADLRLRSALTAYFRWATHAMAAYPESADDVAAGLDLPSWSWDGPSAE